MDSDAHSPEISTRPLPLEIWRAIVEEIQDLTNLPNIALTCKTLRFEAEAVLYDTIHLHKFSQFQHLSDTLKSCPRRTAMARSLRITLDRDHWPNDGRNLDPEVVQSINTLLKMLVRLRDLSVECGKNSWNPGGVEEMLEGCTFELRALTCDLTIDDPRGDFFHVLARYSSIEELNLSPTAMRLHVAIPADILPRLRILRASASIVVGLQAPHCITHLNIAYESQNSIDFVLKLLGHQLVSLSMYRRYFLAGNALPFTESQSVDLPCLTRIATLTCTGEVRNVVYTHGIRFKLTTCYCSCQISGDISL